MFRIVDGPPQSGLTGLGRTEINGSAPKQAKIAGAIHRLPRRNRPHGFGRQAPPCAAPADQAGSAAAGISPASRGFPPAILCRRRDFGEIGEDLMFLHCGTLHVQAQHTSDRAVTQALRARQGGCLPPCAALALPKRLPPEDISDNRRRAGVSLRSWSDRPPGRRCCGCGAEGSGGCGG